MPKANLNIKSLARNSKLSKSIYDVAWGAFMEKSNAVAVKRGVHVGRGLLAIRPYILTIHHMHCSNCGHKVPKTLSEGTPELS